jgi:hypothetical protein
MTHTYGAVCLLAVNPVEKRPFSQFHPGIITLTTESR